MRIYFAIELLYSEVDDFRCDVHMQLNNAVAS
ncbi:hypothetical protein J2S01_000222 [Pectinatus haikarae]|uniref:Uncharacterized protein n=1 Tax=Pectinatus haikarae TaxID=349096 RepID=A0ABT9Y3Y3_9FIRM|nr:hypothetical protein [Pectinatus haikarae]